MKSLVAIDVLLDVLAACDRNRVDRDAVRFQAEMDAICARLSAAEQENTDSPGHAG